MLGNLGKLAGVMKNAKKIEEMMHQAQDELSKIIVTGEAGAGAVKIEMTAKNQVIKIDIEDEILKDKAVLQDLIAAACNNASQKVAEETKSRMMGMSQLLGGDLGDLLGGK